MGSFPLWLTTNPKQRHTRVGKSRGEKNSSQSLLCGLEQGLDYLSYCMTVGCVRSVNRGWCMAAGGGGAGIYSFMWLPALHSSAVLCVSLLCSLLSDLALHLIQLCSDLSGKHNPAFCSRHVLSDSFSLCSALLSGQSSWLVLQFLV